MAGTKLYTSREWLSRRYLRQRKSVNDIAEECGVNEKTIRRYIEQFRLIR